ncbi:LPXTG cell wall anchor domain-containing protein [Kutzneria kofuensis]|uniref:LPXTG-motif cell wall-anchored protein n=1 Tax=Kutzneria kofuensis TaxID=103725 RepID=A0A7W9NHD4_9PSEU|nr:LPXTG cell wall anchor domain-containing protein [Kutzneria kofuensis]MBB5892449.1 LPXTG-motif cell wall-anchored protein [Kutzneria kofuensis]
MDGQSPVWNFTEGDLTGRDIAVEPGPDQPDPYAPTTAPTTPTPQASPRLANTGAADVQAMTIAAIAALVLGVGLVLMSLRRRTS